MESIVPQYFGINKARVRSISDQRRKYRIRKLYSSGRRNHESQRNQGTDHQAVSTNTQYQGETNNLSPLSTF